MFARISVVSIALLTAFTGVVHAAPMDVYAPPLLTPAKGAEWIIGTEELVTWYAPPSEGGLKRCTLTRGLLRRYYSICRDTSHPPKQITSRNATIYLSRNGYLDYSTSFLCGILPRVNEMILGDVENPLATGFDIMDGQRRVIVPNVPEDINYQLVCA